VHFTAEEKERVIFSAGKIGRQVEMNISELKKAIPFKFADIVRR
jgi:prolyl-tRNA editing enzyme YbaK/EbsC (Cys-tRNA(Pro) deacylase)